jgi:hypothetical protein
VEQTRQRVKGGKLMYDKLVKALRNNADHYGFVGENGLVHLLTNAADAIQELQKAVLRLEEESGILDELPMVDQSTPCDTCLHKGNVDFDYCHICNNETDMYKPKPPKEE